MIKVFVGKPGTGKTYSLVYLCQKLLNENQNVYSNFYIDINKLNLKTNHGSIYFWENIDQLYKIRQGCILIDEIQIYMNSRNWSSFPLRLQYKLQQHRKQGLNIYGAVQNLKRIDLVFRELVNSVYEVRKLGKLFFVREYDPLDVEKTKKKTLSFDFYLFNQKLANAYDTFKEIRPFTL